MLMDGHGKGRQKVKLTSTITLKEGGEKEPRQRVMEAEHRYGTGITSHACRHATTQPQVTTRRLATNRLIS